MESFCICGQAIGSKRYREAMPISRKSLIAQGYKGKFLTYVDVLPKGCPPHPRPNHIFVKGKGTVPYAFKAYTMREAQSSGYRYVGYLDSVIVLQKPFSVIMNMINEHSYFLGKDSCDLGLYTSDACLKYFGLKRKEILGKPSIFGGIMFLDLEVEKCRRFLDEMLRLAYPGGPYCADWNNKRGQVSKDKRVKGHRPHQSVATILAMKWGMTHFVSKTLTYGNNPKSIFRMLHTKDMK